MHQLLDLLARQFAAPSQLAEDALAVGTSLVDHLATLLFGHDQFGLGIRRRILTATRGLDLGLFTQTLCLVGGLAQHP